MRMLSRASVLAAMIALCGCYGTAHHSSPWIWGGGVSVAPGLLNVGQGDATIHPVVGYKYLDFDGGNTQILELGGQLRFPMGSPDSRPFWIGGEATYSRAMAHYDNSSFSSPSNNGYSINGLFGVPVGTSRWQPSIYAGAGISDYGGDGWNIRLGLDLQPAFLWSN